MLTYPLECWIHQGQTKPRWHYREWVKFFYWKFSSILLFYITTQIKPQQEVGDAISFFKKNIIILFQAHSYRTGMKPHYLFWSLGLSNQSDESLPLKYLSMATQSQRGPLRVFNKMMSLKIFAMGPSDLFTEKFAVTWYPKVIIVQKFASERLCLQFTYWHAWWREYLKI